MPDAIFEEPRLADIYDLLDDPERPDLVPYMAMVKELGGTSVLDVGCGTGTFACLLAQAGVAVTGVDPAAASLAVARLKPFSERVHWVQGDAASALPVQVDLVTMTGNVAQVFVTETDWSATLRAAHAALGAGGRLVFEVRNPQKEAWRQWTKDQTYRNSNLPGVGPVETWTEVTEVEIPLVTFRQHFVFGGDGSEMVSTSVLCFRSQAQITESLAASSFVVQDVREAADRPGLELVFIAGSSD